MSPWRRHSCLRGPEAACADAATRCARMAASLRRLHRESGALSYPHMTLKGSTALVTGGAVRIGRAVCEALAAEGCRVVVHYHRSAAAAKTLAAELSARGVAAFTVHGQLATERDCARVLEATWRRAGRLNILINNASVFHKDALLAATERKLLAEFRLNALVPVMLTRAFALKVGERDSGCKIQDAGCKVAAKIVNLLDRRIAGTEIGCLPYLLSKKVLAEFTRVAALELAPHITVNGVAPGAILPPRKPEDRGRLALRSLGEAGRSEDGETGRRVWDYAGRVPLERQCTPEEVAAAVIFLLQSDAITGQTIFVDGGQHLLGSAAGAGHV